MSRRAAVGLAYLLLANAPASWASDWNGSYAADGRCYCSGTLDPRLASRIVPTPRGGQSVQRVCTRLGRGPGLSFADGRFDRVVYADAQCGHGPAPADVAEIDPACAGTMAPGTDDCRAVGPRWDLAGVYARADRAAAEAVVETIEAGVMGAPAAPPAMGAGLPERKPSAAPAATGARDTASLPGRVVEIDGRLWREAPAGTPERGAPGTRIILDGQVFLDVEKTSPEDFLPRAETPTRPKTTAVKRVERAPVPKPAARRETLADRSRDVEQVDVPAAESRRERRDRLAKARERREARESAEPAVAAARPATTSEKPAVTPTVESREPAPTVRSDTAEALERPDATAEVDATERDVVVRATDEADDGRSTEARTAAKRSDTPSDASTPATTSASPTRETLALERGAETLAGNGSRAVEATPPTPNALRVPSVPRARSREFAYVDAMPTSYAYGGAGLTLEGSAALQRRFRALARVGAAADYQELLIGGSWYVKPPSVDRLTVVMTAGVETGRFELEGAGVSTELSDSGLYLGAASRLALHERFELQAGVGYSSFFEGDPIAFGGGRYRVAPRFDIVSRFELGDNDSLGIGVRYHY